MRWLAYNALALVCVGFGGAMAWTGKDGWFWWLLFGALTAVYPCKEKS